MSRGRGALGAGLALLLPVVVGGPLAAQQMGSLSLHAAGVVGMSPASGLYPGARLDLSFVVGDFSLGPEVALYFTGPASQGAHAGRWENVFTYGGVVRHLFGAGRRRPYVVAGLGRYSWESSRDGAPTGEYLSGSLGIGFQHALTPAGTGPSVELRFHQLLQNTGVEGTRQFLALTAGMAFGW